MADMAHLANTHPEMTGATAVIVATEETVDDQDHQDGIATASRTPMLLVATTETANERIDTVEAAREVVVVVVVQVQVHHRVQVEEEQQQHQEEVEVEVAEAAAAGTETGEGAIETAAIATATVVADAITAVTTTDLHDVTATYSMTDVAATTDVTEGGMEDGMQGATPGVIEKKTFSRRTVEAAVLLRHRRSESQLPTLPISLLFWSVSAA